MKFKITLKDPDGYYDGLQDAVKQSLAETNLPEDEQDMLRDSRMEKLGELLDKWFEYGEYLTVEVDTEEESIKIVKGI